MKNPFEISFADLPESLPVFPLSGVLLLPRGRLSLNIFEQRYLNMVLDSLAADRIIGMIQPDISAGGDEAQPQLFKTGCAGRVSSFMETDDGRLMITLTGICRFDVREEISSDRGYRRIVADWLRWQQDVGAGDNSHRDIDRKLLESGLRQYFSHHNISVDWKAIEKMPNRELVTFLAMNLPFESADKQLLLEAKTTRDRAVLLTTLTGIAVTESGSPGNTRH